MGRRENKDLVAGTGACTEQMFFVRQVADFGNACGTIACLHAVANSRCWVALSQDAPLEKFVVQQESSSPEARGKALVIEPTLRACSDSAAATPAAQTALPARDGPPLDHHFVAFIRSEAGRVIELDGTKHCPVDHGPTTAETFLSD